MCAEIWRKELSNSLFATSKCKSTEIRIPSIKIEIEQCWNWSIKNFKAQLVLLSIILIFIYFYSMICQPVTFFLTIPCNFFSWIYLFLVEGGRNETTTLISDTCSSTTNTSNKFKKQWSWKRKRKSHGTTGHVRLYVRSVSDCTLCTLYSKRRFRLQ